MNDTFSISATGDSFITRHIPTGSPAFRSLRDLICESSIRFTNLETVIRKDEGFPGAQSGGTWASSPPAVLNDLAAYGFNLIGVPNNHSLDYSYGGLEATGHYLSEAGFIYAGIGQNLAEASAIRYMDLPEGRVAFVAVTSTFHESWMAGDQRKDGPGRPGVNHLRFSTINKVNAEELAQLKQIAATCQLNAAHEERIREGFILPEKEGIFRFGGQLFTDAALHDGIPGQMTLPHAGDMKRIMSSIKEATRQADLVLVSLHAHEARGAENNKPADFVKEFCRASIDAGAHSVIGHGPHILRGIEIYKQRPIFYSLGNFIFQNESVAWQPADFYEKYGLDPELKVSELFAVRSGNGTRGFCVNPSIWRSVVASWSIKDGILNSLALTPVSLGFGMPSHRIGVPELSEDLAGLEDIQNLSKEFGTDLIIEGGKATIQL